MHQLISKHRVRRTSREVARVNSELERSIRRLTRKLERSATKWQATQLQRTDWLAKATLVRAIRYVASAQRLLTDRRSPAISQSLDLVRTGLEHAYVLAVLVQEKDEGTEFVVNWAQRMEAKRLKRLVEAPYGDEADKRVIAEKLAEIQSQIGEKYGRSTVDELVARANLRTAHSFTYAQLNPYSHFDLAKTLEMAYRSEEDVHSEMSVSTEEHRCEALYNLLAASVYLAIARRDFGDASIAEEVETCAALLQRTQAIAFQVLDNLAKGI